MDKGELERRTKAFAVRVISFVAGLARNRVADTLGSQLLKSGTSIGANYREANRAQSRNDFIHKIALVEKEAAETQYWLELFDESKIGSAEDRRWLLTEVNELVAIFTSIGKTAKSRRSPNPKSKIRNPKW
ncbi:MAG: four helix bundle protein [Terriglobia bacterium]